MLNMWEDASGGDQSRIAEREKGIDLYWPLPACVIDRFSAPSRFSSHT